MYFANPFTPSTEAWNSPGAKGLSTSAITAMWISVAVMPTSVAAGFSLPVEGAPAAMFIVPADITTNAAHSATHRAFVIAFPPVAIGCSLASRCAVVQPSDPGGDETDVELEQLVRFLGSHPGRVAPRQATPPRARRVQARSLLHGHEADRRPHEET